MFRRSGFVDAVSILIESMSESRKYKRATPSVQIDSNKRAHNTIVELAI
jgi:hypothetical protein